MAIKFLPKQFFSIIVDEERLSSAVGAIIKANRTGKGVVGDGKIFVVDIDDAIRMFKLEAPSGLRLKIVDMQRAPQVALALSKTLSGDLLIRDWSQQNRNWFAAVQTEKRMMFIILTLIIAVAAFNLYRRWS